MIFLHAACCFIWKLAKVEGKCFGVEAIGDASFAIYWVDISEIPYMADTVNDIKFQMSAMSRKFCMIGSMIIKDIEYRSLYYFVFPNSLCWSRQLLLNLINYPFSSISIDHDPKNRKYVLFGAANVRYSSQISCFF